jgi:hypothetical protein
MTSSLGIIDKFAPNFEEIRRYGLSLDYSVPPTYDGHEYPGFSPPLDPRFTLSYTEAMAGVFGIRPKIQLQAFVYLRDHESTKQWIHSDGICAKYASVHYLFDGSGHGTQFWRHVEFDADTMSHVVSELSVQQLSEKFQREGNDESFWVRSDLADSRPNRFIWYPSDRFHSRAQQCGFTSTDGNGRLVLVTFFDL